MSARLGGMADIPEPLPTLPELEADVAQRPRRQRLFFALWPYDGVRRELAALAKTNVGARARLVVPENIHLTLQFLGSIDAAQRELAESVAKGVMSPPFVLCLDRFGVWRKPKVAWSAPSNAPSELFRLVEMLRDGLEAAGFVVESRPYQAHVTLARKVADAHAEVTHKRVLWNVGRFYLVESMTHASGVQYRLLKSWPLRIV